ncbi:unnamed protein product [Pedinophyceae sp. YPF-701]|nr:unnamed protein product [Pedinophyceae sp. YPF-701]
MVAHKGRSFRTSVVSMGLRTGIVGLPNVGKSTMFNALTESSGAQAANFPFCTIEPNTGVVEVPDPRLAVLSEISSTKNTIPAVVEFVDIAGLVEGASKGEGLGNKFLDDIRNVDCIVHVVRCFEDENVVHVSGRVDPVQDSLVINGELALSDYAQIERRLERMKKLGKKEDPKKLALEEGALKRIMEALEEGLPARSVELTKEEAELVRNLNLLTIKPMIYAANVAEDDLADKGASNEHVTALRARAEEENQSVVIMSAKVEEELVDLDEEERAEFLAELGAEEGGLKSLIRAAYSALGLQTYFTTGEKETRAWTIRKGMTAPQAAGVIHTDFEKGFIRAETVSYDDFVACNGYGKAKETGKLRLEGKEYVVSEGDVLLFRFNV